MKKTWISILIVAGLLLSSCMNIDPESTIENLSETTAAIETTSKAEETTTIISVSEAETTPMTSPGETETTEQSITETRKLEVEVTTLEQEVAEQTTWAI